MTKATENAPMHLEQKGVDHKEKGFWTGRISRSKVVILGHVNGEAEERSREREV